jgi:glycosyltransferase involved in cell wall biosynthesis
MKVLLAVHHFPPHYTGGAEWRAYRTAVALAKRGYETRVICVERPDAPQTESASLSWMDDCYEGVPVRRLFFNMSAAPDPFVWSYDNPWIGQHLRGFLQDFRPDVFHLIGGYLISGRALQVAQELAVPTLVTLTDFWFLCPRITLWRSNGQLSSLPIDPAACAQCLGEERRRYRWLARLFPGVMRSYWRGQMPARRRIAARLEFLLKVLNDMSIVISPSQFLRKLFIEAGVAPDRIVFSRQGRDFLGRADESPPKTRGTVLRVGYLGQIAELKGVHVLFEAAQHVPGAGLTVRAYGDPAPFPAYTRRLQRLAAQDRRLQLAGVYRGAEELRRIMSDLDVIVVPSIWYENSPNVILEAYAHRTPVIASDLGGMAELVKHGQNGLLFAPGDAVDLARQIQRILSEPNLLTELQAGIEPVRGVTEEMDELEAFYHRAVHQAHPTSGAKAAEHEY